jgi:hypothetical protein
MQRISDNMISANRRHRYAMLGTLSSGHDSVTVATLARDFGIKQAVSIRRARGSGGLDDGEEIARLLGLHITLPDRTARRSKRYPEMPFSTANPRGGEVFLSAADNLLKGRLLVTGFQGDKVRVKYTEALGPEIARGPMSGLFLFLSTGCW